MSANPRHRYTFGEYLALERKAPNRSEFHDGDILALAAASVPHNQIVVNITTSLRLQFRGGGCRSYSSDLKVWIPSERRSLYPDIVIACGEHQYHDAVKDVLLDPVVLIEVLSPSTESYDRGAKFRHYRSIPTLDEYLLVSQTEARVERFLRDPRGTAEWVHTEVLGASGEIELRSAPARLSLVDIYEDVDIDRGQPQ